MRTLTRPVIRRTLGATASAGLAMTLLAACGTGSTAAASNGTGTGTANNAAGTGAATGTGRTPGVNGQIAAVSGKTLQVQGAGSQTAVTYTASTTVTQIVSAAQSDLAVGKCVTVTPVASANTGTTGAAPDLTAPVTASSVSITDPVNGSCMRGAGFGGGAGGGHRAGATGATGATGTHTPPAGTAPGATGAFAGGRGFGGGGVSGTVASISGDTMTVTMTRPAAATGATGATGTTTTTRTVTLNSATTYTKVEKAADSALTVGKCVSAQGTTDSSTGMLTANSITIRPMTNGSCSTGGGRGGFGRGAGAGAGAAAGGASTGIAGITG